MRQSVSTVRVLSYALLAVAVAAGTTGCFKRGARATTPWPRKCVRWKCRRT